MIVKLVARTMNPSSPGTCVLRRWRSRPQQVRRLQPFAILPGLRDGDKLHLAVRANAMDRRGVVDMGYVVQIGQSGWLLDSVIPPDF